MTEHSYEEIYGAAIDLLAGRERSGIQIDQFIHFRMSVADLLYHRELLARGITPSQEGLRENQHDSDLFQEVFWDLFRQGIIMLGSANVSDAFPFLGSVLVEKDFLNKIRTHIFFMMCPAMNE